MSQSTVPIGKWCKAYASGSGFFAVAAVVLVLAGCGKPAGEPSAARPRPTPPPDRQPDASAGAAPTATAEPADVAERRDEVSRPHAAGSTRQPETAGPTSAGVARIEFELSDTMEVFSWGARLELSVESVVFAPDGQTFASGGTAPKIWKIGAEKPVHDLDEVEPVNDLDSIDEAQVVVYSPDGSTLALGCNDATIRLWDVAAEKWKDAIEGAHEDGITSLAFSPDGKLLASSGYDNQIRFWSTENWENVRSIQVEDRSLGDVAFSPDGKTLASAGQSVLLWKVETGEPLGELAGNLARVDAVTFSSDGRLIATGEMEWNVKLWDARTKKLLATLKGHDAPVVAVAFSPDGSLLASGGWDSTVKLWSVADRKLAATLEPETEGIESLAWAPQGGLLASASQNGSVQLWSAATAPAGSVADVAMPAESVGATPTPTQTPVETPSASPGTSGLGVKAFTMTPDQVAMVSDAREFLDLRKLPRFGDAELEDSEYCRIGYEVAGSVQEVEEFYDKLFREQGWTRLETPAPTQTEDDAKAPATQVPEHAFLLLTKAGYHLQVAAMTYPQKPGIVNLSILNQGNVDSKKLPRLPDAVVGMTFGPTLFYTTPTPAAEAAAFCRKEFTDLGWLEYRQYEMPIPYPKGVESLNFKCNGVSLSIYMSPDLNDPDKTSVNYTPTLLVNEFPALEDAREMIFSDAAGNMKYETPTPAKEVIELYLGAAEALGWKRKAHTGRIDDDEAQLFFDRSDGHKLVLNVFGTTEGGAQVELGRISDDDFAREQASSFSPGETPPEAADAMSDPDAELPAAPDFPANPAGLLEGSTSER